MNTKQLTIFYILILFYCIFLPRDLKGQNTISEFLHHTKIRYEETLNDPENTQFIHFVMGNESADLDSIVSSIAYAYLLNQEITENQTDFYVPLINIHREDISLRKDVLYLFQLLNISLNDILFLNDNTPLNQLFNDNRLRLNLVDHNVLRPQFQHLSTAVERIVDHHYDANVVYPLVTEGNKLVVNVGSNTTLIAEKFFSEIQFEITPEFAAFLLAPIIIDTSNFISADKTTLRDIYAGKQLQDLAIPYLPQEYYQTLLTAKNDVSELTPTMLLSKDFKEYLDNDILYGIASFPSSIQWKMEDLEYVGSDIKKFAQEKNLTFLILLMPSNDPYTKRHVLVYSPSIDFLNTFDHYVQTDKVLKNILIPHSFSNDFKVILYKTTKPFARKQLPPLLHAILT